MQNSSEIFRRLGVLGLLIMVASLLVSCASMNMAPSYPTNTLRPTPDYNRWLRKQPCAAPCWEGITPGITMYKEAQKLLGQNGSFINIELQLPSEINWNWRGLDYGGRLNFDAWAERPTIQSIFIFLPEPVKLGNVIATFGYPSHVGVVAEPGGDIDSGIVYDMHLYYISSGFDLSSGESGDEIFVKPTVSPETEMRSVVFFAPTINGLREADVRANPIPWQGTFDFNTYCKLRYPDELWRCE